MTSIQSARGLGFILLPVFLAVSAYGSNSTTALDRMIKDAHREQIELADLMNAGADRQAEQARKVGNVRQSMPFIGLKLIARFTLMTVEISPPWSDLVKESKILEKQMAEAPYSARLIESRKREAILRAYRFGGKNSKAGGQSNPIAPLRTVEDAEARKQELIARVGRLVKQKPGTRSASEVRDLYIEIKLLDSVIDQMSRFQIMPTPRVTPQPEPAISEPESGAGEG